MPREEVSLYTEGYVFDQKGTSSWSIADGEALRYATRRDVSGDTIPTMFISANGHGAADATKISPWQEGEWLMSKKQKLRVTNKPYTVNVEGFGRVRIIEVEEV